MSSENNSIVPEKYTTEEQQATFLAGYLGFGIDYLIDVVELKEADIRKQFIDKKGEDYKIWIQGFYMAQTELRKTIMASALSSSTPNLEKMLQYFAETIDELKTLEDE
jgi:hypothetical protein